MTYCDDALGVVSSQGDSFVGERRHTVQALRREHTATQELIEPLRMSFVVRCPPQHAFDTWTARATAWWPPEHTASHERGAEIVFEPRPGGRIFERTVSGTEIEWGVIVEWDPPRRLRYLWRIATEAENATDVEIAFEELTESTTRVDIEHGRWERLGDFGQTWRDANVAGWDGVLPNYRLAAST